jgi:signal peptidase I
METTGESCGEPSWVRTVLIGRNPNRTLVRIVVLVITSVVVFRYALLPIRVEGVSMLPGYRNGGVHFVNRMAYLFHEPRRGDVVAIRYAGIHMMLMKRIVALPGETIVFHEGHVFINGRQLDEPYATRSNWELEPGKMTSDEYYVVGDNRSMPESDHTKGGALRSRIVGKVIL